tara:strand:- start:27876 stop:28310 length:435 start_codon:yes stop_codon:yes gene_type:complete
MEKQKSAGAIVFIKEKKPIYLLLHYEEGHWDFPKGHIEAGESDTDTIKREVKEETGIKDVEIIRDFKEKMQYYFKFNNELINKTVVFYLAKTETKKVKLSFEHIGSTWLPYKEAIEKLTFKNAKEILKKANKFIKTNKTLDEFS